MHLTSLVRIVEKKSVPVQSAKAVPGTSALMVICAASHHHSKVITLSECKTLLYSVLK